MIQVLFAVLLLLLSAFPVSALGGPVGDPSFEAVRADVYILRGQGGNLALLSSSQGSLLVDDQYAPAAKAIRSAVEALGAKPVRLLLNTHWHQDHTGGNEFFGQSGAIIVAHDNVRKRLSTDQFIEFFSSTVPASAPVALPMISFSQDLSFHLGDELVRVYHLPEAHTDGDAIVHFRKANVFHLGDIFFSEGYPFIDLGSGGSAEGLIEAVDRALALVDQDSLIIPGHGPVARAEDLRAYRYMLRTIVDRVAVLKAAGMNLDALTLARPTATFDARWGAGLLSGDDFATLIYLDHGP